ncbi:MAG: toxin-antitoxin system protein [Planctomycetia bacterium 21-64-5]|nr:MAG: toxin-antitoxin system protein [Planctomycetia bacterium 21-64-5]HQU42807.1 hypothetical protein [Pirellulales bacterium]
MATVTVPISEASHKVLLELASHGGEPIERLLDRAIEEYRRSRLLDETNAAFAALRSDEGAWREELAERQDWDATLADGLDEA